MKSPSGLPDTTDDNIWVIKKTVYGFIVRDTTVKVVTYIVGYEDDLIVADRSNKNHV